MIKKILFILLAMSMNINGMFILKWLRSQKSYDSKKQTIDDKYHKKFFDIRRIAATMLVIFDKPEYAAKIPHCPLAHKKITQRAKTAVETLAEIGNHSSQIYSTDELKNLVFTEPIVNYKSYKDLLEERVVAQCAANEKSNECKHAIRIWREILDHLQQNPEKERLSQEEIKIMNQTWQWAKEQNCSNR